MGVFLLFQALLTLFTSGGLYFKENSLKNKTIAMYFLLFSLDIMYFLYGTSRIPELVPEFYGRLYFSIGLLYGPLLYFHFRAVLLKKNAFKGVDLLHLAPLLILNIYMLPLTLMEDVDRLEYYNNPDNFMNHIIYLNYIRAVHQIAYAIILLIVYKKHILAMSINERFYLGGLSVIYFLTTIVITLFTLYANSWADFRWYYITCNVFVLLIGYVLYKDPKFFRTFKAKYQTSSLTSKDKKLISEKIINLFKNEAHYLSTNFSVDALASLLNEKPHHISQTFSSVFKENFNDYINKLRISHARKMLMNPDFNKYKIEAIGEESGFNNKVTFYKAFTKFTGTTPAQYRKKHSMSKE